VVILVDALISASLVQRALIVPPAEMVAMWAGVAALHRVTICAFSVILCWMRASSSTAEFKKFLPRGALELTVLQREVQTLDAQDHLRRLVDIEAPDHSI